MYEYEIPAVKTGLTLFFPGLFSWEWAITQTQVVIINTRLIFFMGGVRISGFTAKFK
jgi:hypothetical protein